MEKWFSGSGFAAARDARRCSGFVHIAIADSAIAARLAARKPGAGSTGRPTAAISGVWKAGSIIGTGSARTAQRHVPAARDGSIFPFGHFSGTIRLWRNDHDAGGGRAASSRLPAGWKSEPISGCAARSVAGQAASSILSHIFHDEGELG